MRESEARHLFMPAAVPWVLKSKVESRKKCPTKYLLLHDGKITFTIVFSGSKVELKLWGVSITQSVGTLSLRRKINGNEEKSCEKENRKKENCKKENRKEEVTRFLFSFEV
jgi:hypothetical protein